MEAMQKLKYGFAITIQSRSENENTTNIVFFTSAVLTYFLLLLSIKM